MSSNKQNRKEELLNILQGPDSRQPRDSSGQYTMRKEELSQILPDVPKFQQNSSTDRELLTQCRSDDKNEAKSAFRQLVQRHQNRVYTYVNSMVGDDAAAFEMTRDVFVQAYKDIERIPRDMSCKVWILKLAKKQLLKASRNQKKWYIALLPLRFYQWSQEKGESGEFVKGPPASEEAECQDICDSLSAYLDDELSPSETTRVENHLATCPECCREYEQLLKTVDMLHGIVLMPDSAKLHRAIYEAIEREIFWTNAFSSFKRLADIFPSPANRVALAAGMTLILCFGFFISYQHEQINRLETELTHFRGSDRPAVKNPVDTFVIFTGRFVSEALPIAAGEYAAHLVPEADKSEVRFIAGEFSEIGDRMEAFVRSLQGELKENRVFQENDLVLRKMIVELPQNSDATLSLFLQGLEQGKEAQSSLDNMPVISLKIFILDRKF